MRFTPFVPRLSALVLALALAYASNGGARAQDGIPLRLGKEAKGMHIPVHLEGVTIYGQPPDEHYLFMVEDALDKLQREKDILVLSVRDLKNGFALLTPGRKKGDSAKVLVFDEDELNVDADAPDGRINNAIALLTIAHEIGHHLCRHLQDRHVSPWEQELEADQVAGAILVKSVWRKWFNGQMQLEDVLEAGRRVLGDEQGSATHPPLSKRLEAIRTGWTAQSPKAALGSCLERPEKLRDRGGNLETRSGRTRGCRRRGGASGS
jgi:hypothetical protein